MLNKEQQDQYIAFVANFVQQLREAGIERAIAENVAILAAATMLGAVLHVMPEEKRLEDFAVAVITQVLDMVYHDPMCYVCGASTAKRQCRGCKVYFCNACFLIHQQDNAKYLEGQGML